MTTTADVDLTKNTDLIISQYANSLTLQTFITGIAEVLQDKIVDVLKQIQANKSVDVATDFFLDDIGANFGYVRPTLDGVVADDTLYRNLLKTWIFQLFYDGTTPFTNQVLKLIFSDGYVVDQLNMGATVVINRGAFTIQAVQDIITTGIIPRPAGVRFVYNILTGFGNFAFGFDGMGKGFDQAPFVGFSNKTV